MNATFLQWLNRLETLSLRERIMVVVGAPMVLVVAGEFLIADPAVARAGAARKEAEQQQTELKALTAVLAARPATVPLPAADQLLGQRNELQAQIDAAGAVLASVAKTVDWGTVVRSTVAGTAGLTLTQLRTLPAELVYAPADAVPVARPVAASAPIAATIAAVAAPGGVVAPTAAAGASIYRHRAELTVTGNFAALLAYLQTLQRAPGDLRWDRLQLTVSGYPKASIQLNLHTLSNRAETPFN